MITIDYGSIVAPAIFFIQISEMSILDLDKQIEVSVEETEFSLKHLEHSLDKVKKIGLPQS